MTSTDGLWGAKAILKYLRDQHGLAITRRTLYRKARRPENPFPLRRARDGSRSHAFALRTEIDAWIGSTYAM